MKILHDWLKDYMGDSIPETIAIENLFTFHAFEVDDIDVKESHTIIDVKILPDRSSDCLSHRGIAHELSALIGTPLAHDPFREALPPIPNDPALRITIHDETACRRFALARITGVKIGPSPDWLRSRLEALGQRSINNVVDATNYVMLALGQPLHAYDAQKFSRAEDGWHFDVRMAKQGECVTTLTGDTYELDQRVQLIVNEVDSAIAGIAGIKGGKYAEVDNETTDIIIEAGNFDSSVTRRASQKLRLQTDASKRFENNISPHLVLYALNAVVALITEIADGTLSGYADTFPSPVENPTVEVSSEHINALLGITVPETEVEDIFKRLSFSFVRTQNGWSVEAPFERTDITIPEDVIAEIGRIYGYEHVASVLPRAVPLLEVNARHYYSERMRALLIERGFSEVVTSSFRANDSIRLANALASDKGCLRSTLRKNIEEVLDRNMPFRDLLGVSSIQVFEIGTVFVSPEQGKGVNEHVSLCVGIRTKQQGYTAKDDTQLTEVASQIESVLGVPLYAHIEHGILELNFSSLVGRLPHPTAYEPFAGASDCIYRPFSSYPFISRDMAFWVPQGTLREEVEEMIRNTASTLLVRLSCFDTFTKEGRTSYAFRLIFQSFDRTLTDGEISAIMEMVSNEATKLGYEIR